LVGGGVAACSRKALLALALALSALHGFGGEKPLLMFRLALDKPSQEAEIEEMLAAIRANPGCCDDLWFATCQGIASLDEHRRLADMLARLAEKTRQMGIVASLQIASTIGHGTPVESESLAPLPWQGWTGSNGYVCRGCSCPRAPGFIKHIYEMARLYGAMKPAVVWIDDDLRVGNHLPAPADDPGCWCENCLAAFSAETGRRWQRAELLAEIRKGGEVAKRWMTFSTASLATVARAIARAFRETSPETQMALQFCMIGCDVGNAQQVLHALYEETGRPVAGRLGAGYYYDLNPNDQLIKSYWTASVRHVMNKGIPGEVDNWCPEIESWPRVYGSRSARSVVLEGFASLAWGVETISMAVSGYRETAAHYEKTIIRPMAKAAPFLHAYARANEGTRPAGFVCKDVKHGDPMLHRFALTGVPLLPGEGTSYGELETKDWMDACMTPSKAVQAKREALDLRAGGTAAVLDSPFIGLLLPRVTADGALRTLGLIASRIEPQGPVTIRVNVGETKAVWHELGVEPVELKVVRTEKGAQVTIPEIGALNCGYIDFVRSK